MHKSAENNCIKDMCKIIKMYSATAVARFSKTMSDILANPRRVDRPICCQGAVSLSVCSCGCKAEAQESWKKKLAPF